MSRIELAGRSVVKTAHAAAVLCILLSSFSTRAQAPAAKPDRRNLTPEEIIKEFSAKETEFYEAWMQYTYRQLAEVKVLAVDGRPSKERLVIESEVVFRDDGSREVQIVRRAGRLRSVGWTEEDTERHNNILPFALTAKELPLYNLKYEGKERIDELDCHIFSVKPKSTRGDRLYFQGKIWVDDHDLQIVRTVGKPVPQQRDNQFPEFETLRQVVDKQYWFPVWTHADSVLHFPASTVRIEETITYEDYKRFGAKATIKFDPEKPKP